MSPVTAAKPRRSAAPLPAFAWRSSVNASSRCSASRISAVPSLDPSSTTMSSMRSGTASTRRTIASIVVRSLYTGITTDSSGSVLIMGETYTVHTMKRLVILAPNWLGDAVMALPAIADVRRAAPAASITVAARPGGAALRARAGGRRHRVRRRRSGASMGSTPRCCCPIRCASALLAYRAGIPERWGYRTDWRGLLLTRGVDARPPSSGRGVSASGCGARIRERSGGAARRGAGRRARRRSGASAAPAGMAGRAARGARAGRGLRRREALAGGVVRRARRATWQRTASRRCSSAAPAMSETGRRKSLIARLKRAAGRS